MVSPAKKSKLSSTEVEKKDFSSLPYDVLIEIFKYLDFKTITYCATLCRTFNDVSHDSVLYNKATLNHNMDKRVLENCIKKITRPKHLSVEYRWNHKESEPVNCEGFNRLVTEFIARNGGCLTSVHFESCEAECVLGLLAMFPNLKDIRFFRCCGSFGSLLELKKLERVHFISCSVPNKIVQGMLECNSEIRILFITYNTTVNITETCETISKFNVKIEELSLSAKLQVKAKGLRALGRCSRLRVLSLFGAPNYIDPKDALEHLAVGCIRLEELVLHGWKKIDDEKLLPILHSCVKLKQLHLSGLNISMKSCRKAVLSLPLLKSLIIYGCCKIKESEALKLQKRFPKIQIVI